MTMPFIIAVVVITARFPRHPLPTPPSIALAASRLGSGEHHAAAHPILRSVDAIVDGGLRCEIFDLPPSLAFPPSPVMAFATSGLVGGYLVPAIALPVLPIIDNGSIIIIRRAASIIVSPS